MTQTVEEIVLRNVIQEYINRPNEIKFYTWFVSGGKLVFSERNEFHGDMYAGFDINRNTFDYVDENREYFTDLEKIMLVPGDVFFDYEEDRMRTPDEMQKVLDNDHYFETTLDGMDEDWLTFDDVLDAHKIHKEGEYEDDGYEETLTGSVGLGQNKRLGRSD